jgi:aldehyde:ferredoxin oxidoreductase
MHGWIGKVLRVNLTKGECTSENLDLGLARKFIGGRGLATKILFDEVDPTVDPLSPENKLIFATGPSTGTALGGARYMVVTKSPLTGTVACSNSGGSFGPKLKFAGYDAIIFEGKSEEPIYLSIVDDVVELRPASHLWGKTTHETEDILRDELADHWKARETAIACIGPAGEKLVRIAAIINDKHRAAARGGVGAVMGSKNLKAIAVRGTRGITVADSDRFREAVLWLLDANKKSPATNLATANSYPNQGTARVVNMTSAIGVLPVRNFQGGVFEEAAKINGEALRDTILNRKVSCFACPLSCGRLTKVNTRNFEGAGEGPEYETICLLGSSCGIANLPAIAKAGYICNELGLDTISMGGTIACAMELFERGFLPRKEAGFELRFGNARAMVKLVRQTGMRQGFGNVLAEGGYRMAERYGHPELFMGVKKQGFAGYEPRALKGMGLGYATSNRGACHFRGTSVAVELSDPYGIKGKPAILKWLQDHIAVADSAGLCYFNTRAVSPDKVPEVILSMLETVVGVGYDMATMLLAGERTWNLERLFNLKAGFTKKDDSLPPRMLEEPIPEGPAKGQVHELGIMLPEYYQLRGWDENGVPTPKKLAELGLEDEGKTLNEPSPESIE